VNGGDVAREREVREKAKQIAIILFVVIPAAILMDWGI